MQMPPDNIMYFNAENETPGLNAIELAVRIRDHETLAIILSNDSNFDPAETDEEGYNARTAKTFRAKPNVNKFRPDESTTSQATAARSLIILTEINLSGRCSAM